MAAIGWATLFALVYYVVMRYFAGAVIVWIGVVSHWVLDFVTHRPDLPLYRGGPLMGMGLWDSPIATVVVEGLVYAVGVWIYSRLTRAKDGIGRWGLWSFVAAVVAFYAGNIFSTPPPAVMPMLIVAIPMFWLLIIWAWWADRHREVR